MTHPTQEVRHTLTDIVLRVIETREQLRDDTYTKKREEEGNTFINI